MVYILGNNQMCPNLEIRFRNVKKSKIVGFSFVDFFGPSKKCQAKRPRATE